MEANGSCNCASVVPHQGGVREGSPCLDIFSISGGATATRIVIGLALICRMKLPHLDHAIRIVRELRQGGEHDDCQLMMIVRNEMLKTVLSLPFLAGCA
jgi:hypothetical protein